MNILLWVLQVFLSLHTAAGAFWKFSNSEQSVPSLHAIPHGVWLSMSVVEILCSVCLILPVFYKPAARMAQIAALCIAAEMLVFCILHLSSGLNGNGQLIYWLAIAGLSIFIAYGRAAKRFAQR